MPGSWSDFLKLRSGPAPPPSSEAGAVRVYADTGGALRSVQSDGTDAPIGGGGGSTPAGSDGQVQFNDNGAFGASEDFTFDLGGGNSTLGLATGENATAEIRTLGVGAQLQLIAADGDVSHVGGEIVISSGTGGGEDGGDVTIAGGDDIAAGTGGNVTIASGSSSGVDSWDGGDIAIRANPAAPAGHRGGDINVVAGQGATGGNVTVQGGGSNGNVQLYSGDQIQAVQLDNNGLNVLATKLGFFGAAPVVQPAAPVTLGDVIAALQALGLVAS